MKTHRVVKVYRMEHETSGAGPYMYGGAEEVALLSHHQFNDDLWPAPRRDGLEEVVRYSTAGKPTDMIFGFANKRQLVRWFNREDRKAIAPLGYRVRLYFVDERDVVYGGKQLAFKKRRAA
jgi:hypothetical protein